MHVRALVELIEGITGAREEKLDLHQLVYRNAPNIGAIPCEVRLECPLNRTPPIWTMVHVGGAMRGAGADQLASLVRSIVRLIRRGSAFDFAHRSHAMRLEAFAPLRLSPPVPSVLSIPSIPSVPSSPIQSPTAHPPRLCFRLRPSLSRHEARSLCSAAPAKAACSERRAAAALAGRAACGGAAAVSARAATGGGHSCCPLFSSTLPLGALWSTFFIPSPKSTKKKLPTLLPSPTGGISLPSVFQSLPPAAMMPSLLASHPLLLRLLASHPLLLRLLASHFLSPTPLPMPFPISLLSPLQFPSCIRLVRLSKPTISAGLSPAAASTAAAVCPA
ncbi:unnamed protein product [Closterium sp. Naga37s-1]|nr:unnamed protein product [Closterium sp. Naga37s-1]